VTKRVGRTAVEAAIGCAADSRGDGVAYVRVAGATTEHLLRVPFHAERGDSGDRAAAYAALTAVARALHERNVGRVRFLLDDPALLADVTERNNVPDALVLAYVRLRCALNQFRDVRFELAPSGDLAQRARAEVALHVAA